MSHPLSAWAASNPRMKERFFSTVAAMSMTPRWYRGDSIYIDPSPSKPACLKWSSRTTTLTLVSSAITTRSPLSSEVVVH